MRAALLLTILVGCNQDLSVAKVQPTLEIQPSPLDFGDLLVGSTLDGSLALSHVGGGAITVTSVQLLDDTGFFSWDGVPPSVPANGAADLVITYAPAAAGYHEATVLVTYNNDEEPTVETRVRGRGVSGDARFWPGLLDFGNVAAGDSRTLSLVVVNDGELDLSLAGAAFSADAFEIAESLPVVVAAGAEAQIDVRFTAADEDAVDETMTLDFGGAVVLSDVVLRANDCERGDPAVYDTDADGYTTCGGDCDDGDASAHPGGVEEPDGADDDCDGLVDDGTDLYDDDGDGYTEREGDCNDADAAVSPGDAEVPDNGVDDDCDGVVDAGGVDLDGDGYGDDVDCDDGDADIWPGAPEAEDGKDNDCDGRVDDGTAAYDDDGDGVTENGGDCDDTDASIYPGARETADYDDDDCDGVVDEGTTYYDDDGDGFTEAGGDCNDANANVNPARPEVSGNGVDDNCDGVTS